mmetsp:Transcript_32418/g.49302  ORF Transcript_32418/g.49302 Transcript_32418/m.49302 type:complete len:164 (-) Transcript_32418:843-1334(-)
MFDLEAPLSRGKIDKYLHIFHSKKARRLLESSLISEASRKLLRISLTNFPIERTAVFKRRGIKEVTDSYTLTCPSSLSVEKTNLPASFSIALPLTILNVSARLDLLLPKAALTDERGLKSLGIVEVLEKERETRLLERSLFVSNPTKLISPPSCKGSIFPSLS